jgi:phosphoribosylamine--glycine ligase
MKVLLLGSGGREHAISWAIRQSPHCSELYIAPGNAGTAQLGTNVALSATDFEAVAAFVLEKHIDLMVVGPEDPIVKGIADYFNAVPKLSSIPVLAPSAAAAQLEGSKDFAKQFMEKYSIPTAAYKTFTKNDYSEAKKYIGLHSLPIVLKADGLAAGKGVTVCFTYEEALATLDTLFIENRFGDAGNKLVIEEYLDGIELSVFVLTDGKDWVLLPEAKDYKRIGDDDKGPNTGGMGAVSPVPFAGKNFMEKVIRRVIEPTIHGLQQEQLAYRGFVFFGLMNVQGDPYVIEYNVRLGDPETEAILPRIDNDLLPLMLLAAKGTLGNVTIDFTKEYAVTVMAVSEGYPGNFNKGLPITGLDDVEHAVVFHAGTARKEGHVITSGGRVLCITSLGDTLEKAISQSYRQLQKIGFSNKYSRSDIGRDLLKYL